MVFGNIEGRRKLWVIGDVDTCIHATMLRADEQHMTDREIKQFFLHPLKPTSPHCYVILSNPLKANAEKWHNNLVHPWTKHSKLTSLVPIHHVLPHSFQFNK